MEMYTAPSRRQRTPRPRPGRPFQLLLLFTVFSSFLLLLQPVHTFAEDLGHLAGTIGSSCQTVCACKWKGGKQTVECIDRALITIPAAIDANTQVLDMSGNNLQTLPADTFVRAGLVNLQRLYLRNCRLGEINADALRGLTNLIELDLSHNLLTAVPATVVLAHVASLRELTLASNPIQKVSAHAFAATQSLTKLDLSHCHLASIAPEAFSDLSSLHTLKLNHNHLHHLRPHTIDTLHRLHGVELHDNPWVCDCRMRPTKIWLTEHRVPYPVAPLCNGGPSRLLRMSFDDVHVDEFACDPVITPPYSGPIPIRVQTGDNATFQCNATAMPMGRVDWYWQGRALKNGTELNPGAAVRQMVWVWEDGGEFERNSRLVMTNVIKSDTIAMYCVVNNPAGSDTAQYVMDVVVRAAGLDVLANREIAGGVSLVAVVLVGLMLWLMVRYLHRREPFGETKTPAGVGIVCVGGGGGGGGQMASVVAVSPTQAMGATTTTTTTAMDHRMYINGGVPGKGPDIERSAADIASGEYTQDEKQQMQRQQSPVLSTNPLQKPPRLGNEHIGYGGINAYVYVSPTGSTNTTDNNPDLISSATTYNHRNAAGESTTAAIDELQQLSRVDAMLSGADTGAAHGRPGSGAYSRAGGCDSLYPSGLWPSSAASGAGHEAAMPNGVTNELAFLRRATSNAGLDWADKQQAGYGQVGYNNNICMDVDADGTASSSSTTATSEYMCRTFPRSGLNSMNQFAALTGLANNGNGSGGGSNVGGGGNGGYPSDYGLPLVHGSEQQLRNSRDVLMQLSQTLQLQNGSSSASLATGSSATTAVAAGQLGMLTAPASAKSLRVWQRGGVPVLPPVTALKRVLNSSRSSPDEGYQEGCGTDV